MSVDCTLAKSKIATEDDVDDCIEVGDTVWFPVQIPPPWLRGGHVSVASAPNDKTSGPAADTASTPGVGGSAAHVNGPDHPPMPREATK
jgi:hypothetical protein